MRRLLRLGVAGPSAVAGRALGEQRDPLGLASHTPHDTVVSNLRSVWRWSQDVQSADCVPAFAARRPCASPSPRAPRPRSGFIGHLSQVYEDVVHVPLVVRFPKGAGVAGRRVRGLVDLLDVARTVAEIFEVQGKDGSDRAFGGRSLLGAIHRAPTKEVVIARTGRDAPPKYVIQHGRLKYIHYSTRGQEELTRSPTTPASGRISPPAVAVLASFYRQALFRWVLVKRQGPRPVAEEVQLTDEQREALKALGYAQ